MNITTFASTSPADDAHLMRCWRIQNCKDCLTTQPDCSWCPFSWTCVPNSANIPFLAPAWDENVCPHWAERWEIRTRPLGCQVSTITTLTSLVTIASTLVLILIVALAVWSVRKLREYGKNPGWRVSRIDWKRLAVRWRAKVGGIGVNANTQESRDERDGEREPLLPS
ncbi:hypothetical protein F4781DRAFT_139816 [Annulohypoxylon bovei var. microspora]|nr:hypothetical protein F4781DRAFT_139816 [Annulohypoxylon bovei var. microspora]